MAIYPVVQHFIYLLAYLLAWWCPLFLHGVWSFLPFRAGDLVRCRKCTTRRLILQDYTVITIGQTHSPVFEHVVPMSTRNWANMGRYCRLDTDFIASVGDHPENAIALVITMISESEKPIFSICLLSCLSGGLR